MFRTTAKIEGMMCTHCEAHVTKALTEKLGAQKVESSHKKGESVIISETELTQAQLEQALEGSGYKVVSSECAPYEKKGLFGKK